MVEAGDGKDQWVGIGEQNRGVDRELSVSNVKEVKGNVPVQHLSLSLPPSPPPSLPLSLTLSPKLTLRVNNSLSLSLARSLAPAPSLALPLSHTHTPYWETPCVRYNGRCLDYHGPLCHLCSQTGPFRNHETSVH